MGSTLCPSEESPWWLKSKSWRIKLCCCSAFICTLRKKKKKPSASKAVRITQFSDGGKALWKKTFRAAGFARGNCYTLQLVSERKEVFQMNNFMTFNHTHTAWVLNYFKWELQKDLLLKWVKSPKRLPNRTKRFGLKCQTETDLVLGISVPGFSRLVQGRNDPPMAGGTDCSI